MMLLPIYNFDPVYPVRTSTPLYFFSSAHHGRLSLRFGSRLAKLRFGNTSNERARNIWRHYEQHKRRPGRKRRARLPRAHCKQEFQRSQHNTVGTHKDRMQPAVCSRKGIMFPKRDAFLMSMVPVDAQVPDLDSIPLVDKVYPHSTSKREFFFHRRWQLGVV